MGLRIRSNTWHYRFSVDRQVYEATTHLEATAQNKAAALAVMNARKQEVKDARKRGGASVKIRFSDAWALFLRMYAGEVKPSSLRRIAVSGASLTAFLGKDKIVGDVTAGDIEDYKTWRRQSGIKEVTIRHDLHALAPFVSYARKKRWIEKSPLEDVKIPSDKDAIRDNVLTTEMEQRYFLAAEKFPLLHDFARVLINQGMRPEEAQHLRKIDVDFDAGTLKIAQSKTMAGRRTLVMTGETARIIALRIAGDSQWVFPSPRGKGKDVPVGRLNNSHDRVCAESGVSCTLYDFRHTFASRFSASGADIPTLCRVLGHSNPRMVMRYVHPELEHVRKAGKRFEAEQVARKDRVEKIV